MFVQVRMWQLFRAQMKIRARMQGETVSSVHERDGWNHTSLVTAAAAEVIVTVPDELRRPSRADNTNNTHTHSHTQAHTHSK